MGAFSFKSPLMLTTRLCLLFLCFLFFGPAYADDDSRNTVPPDVGNIAQLNATQSPLPPLKSDASPFKPGIAVIVALLTTLFSITFLLLLYAKHCKSGGHGGGSGSGGEGLFTNGALHQARKNSGIDRSVIESLPMFRFGSLRGQKEGLDCAVCLNRFEPEEVLRLLPKCKHAFHVECVDTWLDAHSTCPLCRYRVDPEDILLVDDPKVSLENHLTTHEEGEDEGKEKEEEEVETVSHARGQSQEHHQNDTVLEMESPTRPKRVVGRHSSAGERTTTRSGGVGVGGGGGGGSGSSSSGSFITASFRRSFDSLKRKSNSSSNGGDHQAVAVGCFDRPRKDGLLLITANNNCSKSTNAAPSSTMCDASTINSRTSSDRRLEHRIIIGGGAGGSVLNTGGIHQHHHQHQQQQKKQRWSDVQPSDLLYLKSEMIISDGRRSSSNQRQHHHQHHQIQDSESGRNVINERSVSEITGLNRYSSTCRNCRSNINNNNRSNSNNSNSREDQRQAGVVSKWLARVSLSSPSPSSSSSSPSPSPSSFFSSSSSRASQSQSGVRSDITAVL